MFKQVFTLFRGVANEATQEMTDRHALTILRQQIKDAAEAVQIARKAVALAMAQNKQEKEQFEMLNGRIVDLEERTILALEKGKSQIAQEAAETIAALQAERGASSQALEKFEIEINRLRNRVRDSEQRLAALKRGQKIAAATDKTQAMNHTADTAPKASLKDAEETLLRLRMRQKEIDNTSQAISELEQEGSYETVLDKLSSAGCGTKNAPDANDVLKRLSKKIKKSA